MFLSENDSRSYDLAADNRGNRSRTFRDGPPDERRAPLIFVIIVNGRRRAPIARTKNRFFPRKQFSVNSLIGFAVLPYSRFVIAGTNSYVRDNVSKFFDNVNALLLFNKFTTGLVADRLFVGSLGVSVLSRFSARNLRIIIGR